LLLEGKDELALKGSSEVLIKKYFKVTAVASRGVADSTLFCYGAEVILALVLVFLFPRLPACATASLSNRMK